MHFIISHRNTTEHYNIGKQYLTCSRQRPNSYELSLNFQDEKKENIFCWFVFYHDTVKLVQLELERNTPTPYICVHTGISIPRPLYGCLSGKNRSGGVNFYGLLMVYI